MTKKIKHDCKSLCSYEMCFDRSKRLFIRVVQFKTISYLDHNSTQLQKQNVIRYKKMGYECQCQ